MTHIITRIHDKLLGITHRCDLCGKEAAWEASIDGETIKLCAADMGVATQFAEWSRPV